MEEYFGGNLFDAIDRVDFVKGKSRKGSQSVFQMVNIKELKKGSFEVVKLV